MQTCTKLYKLTISKCSVTSSRKKEKEISEIFEIFIHCDDTYIFKSILYYYFSLERGEKKKIKEVIKNPVFLRQRKKFSNEEYRSKEEISRCRQDITPRSGRNHQVWLDSFPCYYALLHLFPPRASLPNHEQWR